MFFRPKEGLCRKLPKFFQGAGALRENHVQYYRNIVEWEVAL